MVPERAILVVTGSVVTLRSVVTWLNQHGYRASFSRCGGIFLFENEDKSQVEERSMTAPVEERRALHVVTERKPAACWACSTRLRSTKTFPNERQEKLGRE